MTVPVRVLTPPGALWALPTHPETPPSVIIRQFSRYLDPHAPDTFIIATHRVDELDAFVSDGASAVVNLRRINDVSGLNGFFDAVHRRLDASGHFIFCFETITRRRQRILDKYPLAIAAPYLAIDLTVKRWLPKIPVSKKPRFGAPQGPNRLLSRAETLGRLYSCGFEVVELKHIDHLLFVVARKTSTPVRDMPPSQGPLLKMRRVGHGGKPIQVYKIRTMYPYSEYLQKYVYESQSFASGGKFKDDFRVTSWGRIFRRYWIDELPMLANLFTGDLKLFGVRPLTYHYESLYPESLRERRRRVMPGLIPPFYADLPKTFDQILESESRYLEAYERAPVSTDLRYLGKAVYNILVKGARSA